MRPARKNKNFKALKGWKKLQYIADYYKFPLVLLCIFLYIIGYALHGHFTHKDTVLYTALVNVNAGESLTNSLNRNFLEHMNLNASKNKLELYTGLYLTDDEANPYHEYTYASRMKIQAVIDGELLDVVLMNREAFDAFSQNGYLCDLDSLLKQEHPTLYERIRSDLTANIIILEDNAADIIFDPSIPYEAVTEEYFYGVDLSRADLIRQAGFEDTVYMGIIANSPRKEMAIEYLQYLFPGE